MSGTMDYRRVVTGIDDDGKSCIILDEPVPATSPSAGLAWRTPSVPADNSGREDIKERSFSFELMHDGGTNFMVAEYPPHSGGDLYWHATDTIDYIVVIKGEVVLVLETGEVRVKAGEFIIDRGVIHAWRNDGDEVAASAIVTIPAKPVGKGKTV